MSRKSRHQLIGLVACLQLVTACARGRDSGTHDTTKVLAPQSVDDSCKGDVPAEVVRPSGPPLETGVWPLDRSEAPSQDPILVLGRGLAHCGIGYRDLTPCTTGVSSRSFVIKLNNDKQLTARMIFTGETWFIGDVRPTNMGVGYTRRGPGKPLELVISGLAGLSVTIVDDGQEAVLLGNTSPIEGGSSVRLPPRTESGRRVVIIGSDTDSLVVARVPDL